MHAVVETNILPALYRLIKSRAESLFCVTCIALLAAESSPSKFIPSPIGRLAAGAAVLSAKAEHGGEAGRIAAMPEHTCRDELHENFRYVYRWLSATWPAIEKIAIGLIHVSTES